MAADVSNPEDLERAAAMLRQLRAEWADVTAARLAELNRAVTVVPATAAQLAEVDRLLLASTYWNETRDAQAPQ